MLDWIGATPLRLAAVSSLVGGAVYLLVSMLLFRGALIGSIVIAVFVTLAMGWVVHRTNRKAFPGEGSTWASLDERGKQAVAHAFRTGEVVEDQQVATAVLERIGAVRGRGKPIGKKFVERFERAEAEAARIAPPPVGDEVED